MKPYMIIEGSNLKIEDFEKKVADALELGYSLAGELIVQPSGSSEVKFYQPVILSEDEDEDEDWDEDEEDDED